MPIWLSSCLSFLLQHLQNIAPNWDRPSVTNIVREASLPTHVDWKMFWQGKTHLCLSKRLPGSCLGKRRYYSASDMKFRLYPRLFPFAMINIMQHGKKFLKATDDIWGSRHNRVLIGTNGMIDPYFPRSSMGSFLPEGLWHRDTITKWS